MKILTYESPMRKYIKTEWNSERWFNFRDRGAVCRPSWLEKFVEPRSGKKNFPPENFEINYLRLAKNAFPKIFQLISLVSQAWWNAYFKPLFGKSEPLKNSLKNGGGGGIAPSAPLLRGPWILRLEISIYCLHRKFNWFSLYFSQCSLTEMKSTFVKLQNESLPKDIGQELLLVKNSV